MNTRILSAAFVPALVAASVALGGLSVRASSASAAPYAVGVNCREVAAVVVAPTRAETREACRAIGQAAQFLAQQGIVARTPFELHLVDTLPPEEATSTRVGVYLHESRRAHVLQRSRWPQDAAPFGLPMTPAVYRSAIVHEAVHAIVADHFRSPRPDVVAHEYLAYVGQLHSLLPELRRQALEAAGPAPTDDPARRLNLFVLGMNPDRFAALAWHHWSRPDNGAAFVHALLEGDALPVG